MICQHNIWRLQADNLIVENLEAEKMPHVASKSDLRNLLNSLLAFLNSAAIIVGLLSCYLRHLLKANKTLWGSMPRDLPMSGVNRELKSHNRIVA